MAIEFSQYIWQSKLIIQANVFGLNMLYVKLLSQSRTKYKIKENLSYNSVSVEASHDVSRHLQTKHTRPCIGNKIDERILSYRRSRAVGATTFNHNPPQKPPIKPPPEKKKQGIIARCGIRVYLCVCMGPDVWHLPANIAVETASSSRHPTKASAS